MTHPETHPEFALSLGGSLISHGNKIDTEYLRRFAILLSRRNAEKQQTAIVVGGGVIARMYRDALKNAGILDSKKLDAVGIDITHVNAKLIAEIWNNYGVRTQYVANLNEKRDEKASVWITGGTVPGQTTDAVLVDWSRILGYKNLINLTDVSHVFEVSPDRIPDKTKPIREMTWGQYFDLLPQQTHVPGEHAPFGIVASIKARYLGLSVMIMDGNKLINVNAAFEEKPFVGTVIHP